MDISGAERRGSRNLRDPHVTPIPFFTPNWKPPNTPRLGPDAPAIFGG